jgi:hypothetical protein
MDGVGGDVGNDKDVVIDEKGVDKDARTEESMAAAVATLSAGWHGDDDEVVVDNDDVDKDSDAFAVRELLTCSQSLRVM